MGLMLGHRRFHLGIFGASGNGKTTFAENFLRRARARVRFVFDAEGEFCQRFGVSPCRSGSEIDAAVLSRSPFVCFDPHSLFPGELESALPWFCEVVLAWSARLPGRKFFVVDELGRYVTTANLPKSLKVLVQTGRRYGVDGVFIAQQPNELHNAVRVQLSEIVCFQLTDATALEFPARFGVDPKKVRALRPFEYIARDNQGRQHQGIST